MGSIPIPPPPANCSGFYHTVVAGETLYTISRRFGVSLRALREANPQIQNPSMIYPEQIICIP